VGGLKGGPVLTGVELDALFAPAEIFAHRLEQLNSVLTTASQFEELSHTRVDGLAELGSLFRAALRVLSERHARVLDTSAASGAFDLDYYHLLVVVRSLESTLQVFKLLIIFLNNTNTTKNTNNTE